MKKQGKPFSPERLDNIRRMRRARRLYKQSPVFAYWLMVAQYPDYTHAQFCEDLRRRSKPKKRQGKSPLTRYGRFRLMEKLLQEYRLTGEAGALEKAMQLRRNMTKPYRMLVRLNGQAIEFTINPYIEVNHIEALRQAFQTCRTEKELDETFERFKQQTSGYGH
jgi:hypothetical protein